MRWHSLKRLLPTAVSVHVLAFGAAVLSATERFDLTEDALDARIFKVAAQLRASGKLFTQPGADNALNLRVDAEFVFNERRREGAGRDAQALRSVRYYRRASASIEA